MSVTYNQKTKKWDVRVQYQNKRIRAGAYKTKYLALKAEADALKRLKSLEKLSVDNCGPYEPKLEQTDTNLINRVVRAFRKRKAEKASDKATKQKLESL